VKFGNPNAAYKITVFDSGIVERLPLALTQLREPSELLVESRLKRLSFSVGKTFMEPSHLTTRGILALRDEIVVNEKLTFRAVGDAKSTHVSWID